MRESETGQTQRLGAGRETIVIDKDKNKEIGIIDIIIMKNNIMDISVAARGAVGADRVKNALPQNSTISAKPKKDKTRFASPFATTPSTTTLRSSKSMQRCPKPKRKNSLIRRTPLKRSTSASL